MPDPSDSPPTVMQCMEIWGGNNAIDEEVSMAGLDVRVHSRPFSKSKGEEREGRGGGDIHFLSSCATGRISRMIVADVSGHGEDVALIASSLRRLMGKFANFIDQRRFMGAVNKRFGELRDENDRYAALFATAVAASYFSPTDELSICNAGHPRPLHFDAESGEWTKLIVETPVAEGAPPMNLPLGVLDEAVFEQQVVTLGERDLVLVYTDALIEASNPSGRQLGESGLIGLLGSLPAPGKRSSGEFIEDLRAAVSGFVSGAGTRERGEGAQAAVRLELDDDLTILVFRRNTAKPRWSLVLYTLAAGRLLRRVFSALVGGRNPVSLPEPRIDLLLGALFGRLSGGSKKIKRSGPP